MHNNIMAAGSRDRPPMLEHGRCAQWRSRFLPVPAIEDSPEVPAKTSVETVLNMTPENKAHYESEKEAIHLILMEWEIWKLSLFDCMSDCSRNVGSHREVKQAQRTKICRRFGSHYKVLQETLQPTINNSERSSNTRNKKVDTLSMIQSTDNQTGQFGNQRIVNVVGARETIGGPVVQQSGIQCFNCKEFGHYAKECRKPKRGRVVGDTDEKIDEQELSTFKFTWQDSRGSKCLTQASDVSHWNSETGDVCLPDSPDMCDNDIQNDQHDVECDDDRAALANLIANLKLDVDENKKIQKQLKKANATLTQELNECQSILAETSRTLGESNSIRDSCLVALQNKQNEFERYKAFNDRTVDYDQLERKLNETLGLLAQKDIDIQEGLKVKAYEISVVQAKHDGSSMGKHSNDHLYLRHPTAQDMEILVKKCLMPLALKTQNDSLAFIHELKKEMHADLKYVESLEDELDELESDKAEFSNMYDMLLQEFMNGDCLAKSFLNKPDFVSKEIYTELLQRFARLEKHSISLEIALQECQVQLKNDTVCKERASNVFRKEREQYVEIQYFDKAQTARQEHGHKNLPKTAMQAVRNTNVIKPGMYRIASSTNRIEHHLGSNQLNDKVVPYTSHAKLKKTEVEEQPRISNKTKSVTACNDSLNSRTSNANCVCATIVQLILFIVDSGCTRHITGNVLLLCHFVEKYLGTVRFGNDQFAPILGYGDLIQGNITIKRVYYVKGLNHNLFSVGQFCDADLEVAFRKSTCFVRDLQGNDLLSGNRGSDLYTISLQETTSSTPICLLAKASPTQAWLWHRRLSHLNFDYINLLSKKDIVIGLPKLKYVKDQLCSSCEVSKAKRSSFKSKTVPSSKGRLNLLHMDLCGPMRVASINGKKYILVIVDDYSRYTWTLFLRSKDETPEVLKDFLTMIQRNLQASVISVRTDRGTEFLNKTLNAFFKEEGIEHQTSTPRTPEQNGVVKRQNRTLVEAARTMLSASKLPLFFWAEAIATACYTQNRSIIIPTHEKTTYHIINDRKPSIKHLHIFGCTCYLTRYGENLDKMKEKRGYVHFDLMKSKRYKRRLLLMTLQASSPNVKRRQIMTTLTPHQNYKMFILQQIQQFHHNRSWIFFLVLCTMNFSMMVLLVSTSLFYLDTDILFHKDTHPSMNIQPTSEPSTPTNAHAEENNVDQAEFTNPFCTPVQEIAESSSRNSGNSNVHTFNQPSRILNTVGQKITINSSSWNPSKPVQIRRQLATDPEMSMQEELHQFDRLQVWELVDKPFGKTQRVMLRKEGIDFDESFAPVARLVAVGSMCIVNSRLSNIPDGT
ncbi:retrovirus-related pol polyprotein from transposon TNT 1-94 [Tanacetum coccineum]